MLRVGCLTWKTRFVRLESIWNTATLAFRWGQKEFPHRVPSKSHRICLSLNGFPCWFTSSLTNFFINEATAGRRQRESFERRKLKPWRIRSAEPSGSTRPRTVPTTFSFAEEPRRPCENRWDTCNRRRLRSSQRCVIGRRARRFRRRLFWLHDGSPTASHPLHPQRGMLRSQCHRREIQILRITADT